MAAKYYAVAALCVVVGAAPPSPPQLYRQPPRQLQQIQQIQPYDYYLENQELANYYSQSQQKQAASNNPGATASRLESLEPDSEVELIPGAQQPQQPPQQNPVSPNLPGLVPGQRVFIVHMPVPGYRPGSIGGYQPVYIVAAAPQGNAAGYPANVPNVINGYQNAVLLDPSGQSVYSPLLGFPQRGGQPVNPGYFLTPQLQRGPYELAYQEPAAYQSPQGQAQAHGQQGGPVGLGGLGGLGGPGGPHPVQLAQLIALRTHANAASGPRSSANESTNAESKRLAQSRESNETKEAEEPRRSARPPSAHVQSLKA